MVYVLCSFIVEFMSRAPDPERDSESVQRFLSTTEGAFLAHPLFVNATDEELESAGEVLFLTTILSLILMLPSKHAVPEFSQDMKHFQVAVEGF